MLSTRASILQSHPTAADTSFVAKEKVQALVEQALHVPLESWRADDLLDLAMESIKGQKTKTKREQHLLELEALANVSTMFY